MKKIFLILIFFPSFVIAQPWLHFFSPNWTFKEPGSSLPDYDNGYILAIMAGRFTPTHEQHTLLWKLDDNGIFMHELQLGNGPEEGSSFQLPFKTIAGDLILPGGKWGRDFMENPMLVKLDSCRQKVWCTNLVNNPLYPDFFWDAVETEDGSIVALSLQNEPDSLDSFHLHKFTPDGWPLWRRELASPQLHPEIWDPEPWKLLLMPDGGFLITGFCYWPNPGGGPVKYIRMFIVKADAEGNEEWLYVHGINDYVYSFGYTSVLYNNKIYTDGYSPKPQNSYSSPHLFVNDLNGNYIYDSPVDIPDTNNRIAKGIFALTNNFDGYFYGVANMFLPNSTEDSRPVAIKIDTLGNVLDLFIKETEPPMHTGGPPWLTDDGKIFFYGGAAGDNPSYDDIYAIRLLPDLELDSISWSNFNYDTLCPAPIVSQIIPLDKCLIVVNSEHYKPPVKQTELIITAAPVPANSMLRLLYDNTQAFRNITLKCFNSIGQQITCVNVNSGINETKLDITNWSPGLYIAVAYSGNRVIGRCKFIVE